MSEKKSKSPKHPFSRAKILVRRVNRSIYAARSQDGRRVLVKVNKNVREARREAMVMKHYGKRPNLVRLYRYYELDKKGYIIMEWLPGKPLAYLIRSKGPFPLETTLSITLQILKGLAALHELGYVHADLHAGNVMVRKFKEEPKAKIIDLQLAVKKRRGGKAKARRLLESPPAHLPPETTRWIDERYDIYGVGFMMGCMLLGELSKKPLTDFPESGPDAPIWYVIQKAVDPDPEQRFATAKEMVKAVKRAARGW